MPRLRYVGADPSTDWLPGWPASDHDEPDETVAAEKGASGLYVLDPGDGAAAAGEAGTGPIQSRRRGASAASEE